MKVHNYSCGLSHKSSVGVVQVEFCLGDHHVMCQELGMRDHHVMSQELGMRDHHVMWSSVGYGRPSCDEVKCWVWETIM